MKFIKTNPRPDGIPSKDCLIRAMVLATDIDYEMVFDLAVKFGWAVEPENRTKTGMQVIDSIFNEFGVEYEDYDISTEEGEESKLHEWSNEENFQKGKFIYLMPGHAACVIDSVLYDTWDCQNKIVNRVLVIKN